MAELAVAKWDVLILIYHSKGEGNKRLCHETTAFVIYEQKKLDPPDL